MAPALHFDQPKGDVDIVMSHGVLTVHSQEQRQKRAFVIPSGSVADQAISLGRPAREAL
jgi:hypothetical protein